MLIKGALSSMKWETKYPGPTSIVYLIANLPGIASDDSADISDLMTITAAHEGSNTHSQGQAFIHVAHYSYAKPRGSCIELNQNSRACRLNPNEEESEICDTAS